MIEGSMTNVVALQDARPAWNYTLADAAADINRKLDELAEANRRVAKAKDRFDSAKLDVHGLRFSIGDALIDARKMLKEQDPHASFEAWCDGNIKRTMRDCYACMQYASQINAGHIPGLKAAVAAGAVPQEWSAANEQSRQQQTRSVQTAIGLYRKMTVEERQQVKHAQEEIDHAE
jgi:hypothetical protein